MYRVTADRPIDLPTRRSPPRVICSCPRGEWRPHPYIRASFIIREFFCTRSPPITRCIGVFTVTNFYSIDAKPLSLLFYRTVQYYLYCLDKFARPSFRYFMYLSYVSNSEAVVVPGGSRTLTTDKFWRIKSSRATAICTGFSVPRVPCIIDMYTGISIPYFSCSRRCPK